MLGGSGRGVSGPVCVFESCFCSGAILAGLFVLSRKLRGGDGNELQDGT
jgi:hypothetical protein